MGRLEDKRMGLADYTTSHLNIRIERIDPSGLNSNIVYGKGLELTGQRYGQFEVVLNGNGYVSGIEIEYSGGVNGKIIKPDSWVVFHNDNKIIMFDFGASPIDTNKDYAIFEFSGEMKIRNAIATDYSKAPKRIVAKISKLKGDQFDNTDSIWDSKSENFEHIGIPKTDGNKTISINSDPTYVEGRLFYDKTGSRYRGFIKIDPSGEIVTANKEAGLYKDKLYFSNGKEARLKNTGFKSKRRSSVKRKRY